MDSEDQLVTSWTTSVASGYTLLRDPRHNKGIAFTERERNAHYLRGLSPTVVLSQELQGKRFLTNLRQYQVPLHKYMVMMDLQKRGIGEEYAEFVQEFVFAVKQNNYGEKTSNGNIKAQFGWGKNGFPGKYKRLNFFAHYFPG